MARAWVSLLIGLFFMAGCQQQALIDPLPAPSLEGPVVVAPRAAPVDAQPSPAGPQRPAPAAGVPREWLPTAPANGWKFIVIHHSATPAGSAMQFDRGHRAKGWDELGYHFVIGNGTGSRDGQIEVGSRWPKQKWGAHARTADQQYNNFGIGICLVGNFEIERPTPAQVQSLARLCAYLMRTYNIAPTAVIGHGQTGRATSCPGRFLSVNEVRRLATMVPDGAYARDVFDGPARTAATNLAAGGYNTAR
jgi:hypothetical protein